MKHNLLLKTTVACAVITALSACSDVDKGYDPEISASDPVVITQDESFTAALTEDSGLQQINLVDGVQIGGVNATEFAGTIKITQMEFAADQNFVTPETDSNSSLVSSAKVSPFWLAEDGRSLVVDTDKFSESLRFCDNTDLRGGPQNDGAPTPDGNPDFPSAVTYTISYEINNGHNYAPGTEIPRRTLQLNVNAATDPVTSVAVANVSVPAGGSAAVVAQTAPVYACNNAITYSVADTSVATVDATTGVVTGVGRGTTTITATSVDGGHTATADVSVTAGVTIDITNGDVDELGALTGTKSIPECVRSGLVVEPNLLIDGESFTGDYSYDWMSSDGAIAVESEVSREFGGTAILAPANVGDSATLTAEFGTGYTAGVDAGDIDAKSVDVTVVENIACDTENPADATPYDFSNGFESDTTLNGGAHIKVSAANGSTRWIPTGSMSSVSPALGEGFGGSNAMKITVLDADNGGADVPRNGGIGTLLQRWNSSTGSWTASNFGRPTSIGKTFEFSIWVKLNSLVEEGQERSITNFMFPWKTADDATYHSIPEYNSWGRRYAPFNMQLTKTLANTTEWQLVELGQYTIPEDWSGLPQPIKYNFHFEGDFVDGDEILLEDLAVVEK